MRSESRDRAGIGNTVPGYTPHMVTWLSRSLLFIVAGAVLAYAVTIHNDTIDLQTTGVILLLVGIFDLLLNFGLSMYLRHPAPSADPYRRGTASPGVRPAPRTRPGTSEEDLHTTRPIRRDDHGWH